MQWHHTANACLRRTGHGTGQWPGGPPPLPSVLPTERTNSRPPATGPWLPATARNARLTLFRSSAQATQPLWLLKTDLWMDLPAIWMMSIHQSRRDYIINTRNWIIVPELCQKTKVLGFCPSRGKTAKQKYPAILQEKNSQKTSGRFGRVRRNEQVYNGNVATDLPTGSLMTENFIKPKNCEQTLGGC